MVNNKMVACVGTGGGALLVRVPEERDPELLERAGTKRAEMGGRSMGEGWIAVEGEALVGDQLRFWIDVVLAHNAETTTRR